MIDDPLINGFVYIGCKYHSRKKGEEENWKPIYYY